MSSYKNEYESVADPHSLTSEPDGDDNNKSGLRWAYSLLCGLIILPITTQWLPSEVALWKQADARNHWDAKDPETALKLSSQALHWDADNPSLLTERADWLAELERYDEAIDIYQALIATLTTTGESAFTIQLRIQLCNHFNSRSAYTKQPSDETWQQWEIINTWYRSGDRIKQLSLLQEANLYNNQAYQLAVSNSHLEEALGSASKCLELLGGEIYCLYSDPMYYVQTAYQAYSQKKYRIAMENLNKAVDKLGRHHALLQATSPKITWKAFEKKKLAQRIADFEVLFGNVLLFRAACLKQTPGEELSQNEVTNKMMTDRLRAKDLGVDSKYFTPKDAHFGNLLMSFRTHSFIPMALDTRGYLYHLLGNHHLALIDLEVAVGATEYELKQFDEVLTYEKDRVADIDFIKKQRHERAKNLAVILYHRSLAYDATHRVAKAQKDREKIEQLGFSAGSLLH
ncbi:MAG: hypothetical protein CMM02_00965 [Rhodopirellula sp.]|nr:hypothetical protein [Rhodopirellula sp.]